MPAYITTYGGTHFYPLDPNPAGIHISDIAHALSLICRGNGHVMTYYSVGQHCLQCAKEAEARGLTARIALACLLHDAGECYMSDVPRPLKQFLPAYNEAETKILDIIYGKYMGSPLTEEEQKALKAIDDDVLWYDLTVLLRELQKTPEPDLKLPMDYSFTSFSDIESRYLSLFHQLIRAVNPGLSPEDY